MDFVVIGEMVESLGFPIVVSGALFWSNRETVKHYGTIIAEFRKTLHENTIAMEKLIDKIDRK
jgi:hypothetical protein